MTTDEEAELLTTMNLIAFKNNCTVVVDFSDNVIYFDGELSNEFAAIAELNEIFKFE